MPYTFPEGSPASPVRAVNWMSWPATTVSRTTTSGALPAWAGWSGEPRRASTIRRGATSVRKEVQAFISFRRRSGAGSCLLIATHSSVLQLPPCLTNVRDSAGASRNRRKRPGFRALPHPLASVSEEVADRAQRGAGRFRHLVLGAEHEQHRAGDGRDGLLAVGIGVAGHEAAVEHIHLRVAGQHAFAQRHAGAVDPR